MKFAKKDVKLDYILKIQDWQGRSSPVSAMNEVIDVINIPNTFYFYACGYRYTNYDSDPINSR